MKSLVFIAVFTLAFSANPCSLGGGDLVFVEPIAKPELPKPKFPKNAPKFAISYIELHCSFAIELMKEGGIPASVTLAQGILESGFGRSFLAKEHNNFFGVMHFKNDYWSGESFLGKSGNRYRSYPSIKEAYKDRLDFFRLTKFPNGRLPYIHLFDIATNDFRAWCYAIEAAGYAGRGGSYALELIGIIERYNLDAYDIF
jgi:flagellum-specific peptidoglycan hydrolase FlgJ